MPGQAYRLKKAMDGHREGTLVIFKWMTSDGKWAVLSPNGEPDMQSMLCSKPDELELAE